MDQEERGAAAGHVVAEPAGPAADLAPLGRERRAYLVPATGALEIEGVRVNARDGAAISDVDTLRITALEDSEVVLVDAA